VVLHQGTVIERAGADQFFNAPATQQARAFLAGELLL
jgi:ABC-type phosphate transport system ATPase subunit